MTFWDWIAISIAVPLLIFLIVVCVVSACRMNQKDARNVQAYLFASILFMMATVGLNAYIDIFEVPVIGWGIPLAVSVASFCIVYSAIVFATFLFRKRYRKIGFRMVVVCTLAIWWMMLTEPEYTPQYDGQDQISDIQSIRQID